jgi:hypothetical protein
MSRIGAIRTIFFAIGAVLLIAPAWAHSPYFTQTERLALPDGRTGEIRLLHGDGIFLADPVRAMVLDEQGRPLARSSWSGSMTILCNREHRCRVYDFTRLMRHEPDPASFRAEASLDLPNEAFGPVRGSEGYEFTSRRMTMSDLAFGHAAYIAQNRYQAAIAVAASAFVIMLILAAGGRTPRRTAAQTALYYFCMVVAAVLVAPVLALASLAVLVFGGMPLLLWLLLSSAGAVATAFVFWWLTRSPVAARAA